MMKIDYERMTDCLWNERLKFELMELLVTKPKKKFESIEDVPKFMWKNLFGTLCLLSVYLCKGGLYTFTVSDVQKFTKENYLLLIDRLSQIMGFSQIADELLNNAKRQSEAAIRERE